MKDGSGLLSMITKAISFRFQNPSVFPFWNTKFQKVNTKDLPCGLNELNPRLNLDEPFCCFRLCSISLHFGCWNFFSSQAQDECGVVFWIILVERSFLDVFCSRPVSFP